MRKVNIEDIRLGSSGNHLVFKLKKEDDEPWFYLYKYAYSYRYVYGYRLLGYTGNYRHAQRFLEGDKSDKIFSPYIRVQDHGYIPDTINWTKKYVENMGEVGTLYLDDNLNHIVEMEKI